MFLTPGALFVLVVDLFTYSIENSSEDALKQWLDILQSRVPGSVVLLVGTHIDPFATPAEYNKRMQCFKKVVPHVILYGWGTNVMIASFLVL